MSLPSRFLRDQVTVGAGLSGDSAPGEKELLRRGGRGHTEAQAGRAAPTDSKAEGLHCLFGGHQRLLGLHPP